MTIQVDIKTRFLPDDQKVYMIFPGAGYKDYDNFKTNSVVFLDLPGFPIDPDMSIRDAYDLVERVTISQRIAEWHREGAPISDPPVRSVDELKKYRATKAKKQLAGLFRGFKTTIKPGDIIIVPGPTYDDDMLFGEVSGVGNTIFATARRYPKEKIPAIKVKWITTKKRGKIPLWMEKKIGIPNPLRQIEKEHFNYIFDLMYERYHYEGKFTCKFSVKSHDFSTLDNFLFQQIVLYTAALFENNSEQNIDDIANKAIAVVASSIEFSTDIPDQRISINSPGHISVYSKNIIPIVAAVFICLASAHSDTAFGAAAQAKVSEIEIVNSADKSSVSNECTADVSQEVINDLNAMGYSRWQELCQIEEQARKRTQLSSGMSSVSALPRSKPK